MKNVRLITIVFPTFNSQFEVGAKLMVGKKIKNVKIVEIKVGYGKAKITMSDKRVNVYKGLPFVYTE